MELLLMERVRRGIDCTSSRRSRFEDYSLKERRLVSLVKEMMAHLRNVRLRK